MPKRGGSRGRKKPSLRTLSRQRLTLENIDTFRHELTAGSDLACALIGCAFVDNLLRDLIIAHMRADGKEMQDEVFDEPAAPLASLSARITVAYALKLIDPDVRANLDTIRRIRNAFAHSEAPLTFSAPLIVEECSRFTDIPSVRSVKVPRRLPYVAACFAVATKLVSSTAKQTGDFRVIEALKGYAHPT